MSDTASTYATVPMEDLLSRLIPSDFSKGIDKKNESQNIVSGR